MRVRSSPAPDHRVIPGLQLRLVAAALALAAVVTLAGCTAGDPALPRLGDITPSASPGADDLVAVAQRFHDCLTDADLPATYEKDEAGRPTRVAFDDSAAVVGVDRDGATFFSAALDQTEFSQFFADHDVTKPALQVNGIDQTATWTACLDQSGYSLRATFDTRSNDVYTQEMWRHVVDSSNQWAACARQHGLPETKDAVLPTDYRSTPMALLPASITEPQLRQLLLDCPNFDAEQEKKNEELQARATGSDPAAASIPDGVVLAPVIGFDYPGFRGNFNEVSFGLARSPDPTAARLTDLAAILTQAAADYYMAQGATPAVLG